MEHGMGLGVEWQGLGRCGREGRSSTRHYDDGHDHDEQHVLAQNLGQLQPLHLKGVKRISNGQEKQQRSDRY